MNLINKPATPEQKKALADQIRLVNEEINIRIVATRGMLDVTGYDENGVARSSEGYYEELATALVTWINSVPADQAAGILARHILPEIEANPYWRTQHLQCPEGLAAIRKWRRENLN